MYTSNICLVSAFIVYLRNQTDDCYIVGNLSTCLFQHQFCVFFRSNLLYQCFIHGWHYYHLRRELFLTFGPRIHKAFLNQDQDQAQVKNSSNEDFFKTYYNYWTIDCWYLIKYCWESFETMDTKRCIMAL